MSGEPFYSLCFKQIANSLFLVELVDLKWPEINFKISASAERLWHILMCWARHRQVTQMKCLLRLLRVGPWVLKYDPVDKVEVVALGEEMHLLHMVNCCLMGLILWCSLLKWP